MENERKQKEKKIRNSRYSQIYSSSSSEDEDEMSRKIPKRSNSQYAEASTSKQLFANLSNRLPEIQISRVESLNRQVIVISDDEEEELENQVPDNQGAENQRVEEEGERNEISSGEREEIVPEIEAEIQVHDEEDNATVHNEEERNLPDLLNNLPHHPPPSYSLTESFRLTEMVRRECVHEYYQMLEGRIRNICRQMNAAHPNIRHGSCIICLENNIQLLYLPCSHALCCIRCNELSRSFVLQADEQFRCAICRRVVVYSHKIIIP